MESKVTSVRLADLAAVRALEKANPGHPLKLDELLLLDGESIGVAIRIIGKTKISKNGCLEWMAAKDKDGYGVTYYRKGQFRVHRFVHLAWIGNPNGLFVLHRCDNPSCCLPSHLFLGSAKTNAMDAANKGRMGKIRGALAWNARLTEKDVRYILENYQWRTGGRTAIDLARKFNVSVGAVWGILHRKTWCHLHSQ